MRRGEFFRVITFATSGSTTVISAVEGGDTGKVVRALRERATGRKAVHKPYSCRRPFDEGHQPAPSTRSQTSSVWRSSVEKMIAHTFRELSLVIKVPRKRFINYEASALMSVRGCASGHSSAPADPTYGGLSFQLWQRLFDMADSCPRVLPQA